MGLSLSSIFLVYTAGSIVQTFFVTAAAFGALSLYGYTTQARPDRHGLVPDHGPVRADHRNAGESLPAVFGAAVRHLGDRRAGLLLA
jgi:hypothetical protein